MTGPAIPEEVLLQTVRSRLDAAELPVMRVGDLGAGYGSSRSACCACSEAISPHQIEYSVQAGPSVMNFHIVCFSIWQLECAHRIKVKGSLPAHRLT